MGHRCRYKHANEYVQSFFPPKKNGLFFSIIVLVRFSLIFVSSLFQIISVLYNAKAFNSDLSTWNVDAVTDMANSTYRFFTHRQKVGGCDDFLESYFSF